MAIDKTKSKETAQMLYKNAHIALQSIDDVKKHTDDKKFNEELSFEYDGYEKYIGELSMYMSDNELMPKDINAFKKTMLSASIAMKAFSDDGISHLAEMMIKGTVMGVVELKQILSEQKEEIDKALLSYVEELANLEENYEDRLKKFL